MKRDPLLKESVHGPVSRAFRTRLFKSIRGDKDNSPNQLHGECPMCAGGRQPREKTCDCCNGREWVRL